VVPVAERGGRARFPDRMPQHDGGAGGLRLEVLGPDQDDFRIDGKALAPSGRIGPGLVSTIAPDGIWRGIVELRQAEPKTGYAVALGADTRKALVLPLSPGRHTIAVRCGDTWSADVPFYWER
jgi:hypothetical protein